MDTSLQATCQRWRLLLASNQVNLNGDLMHRHTGTKCISDTERYPSQLDGAADEARSSSASTTSCLVWRRRVRFLPWSKEQLTLHHWQGKIFVQMQPLLEEGMKQRLIWIQSAKDKREEQRRRVSERHLAEWIRRLLVGPA